MPLLHQNFIHFENMRPKSEYLFATQTKDTFNALGLDNKVYVWCM